MQYKMDNNGPNDRSPESHDVCKPTTKIERTMARVCPSKLSKRELEDLYFTLLENNLELKRTINKQTDKIKILSTKVQRLSSGRLSTTCGKEKDCCASKAQVDELKDIISGLKKANDELSERIRLLNMRLCSAKQFLSKNTAHQRFSLSSPSASTARLKDKIDRISSPITLQPNNSLQYQETDSNRSQANSTRPSLAAENRKDSKTQCNENKCKVTMEELRQTIVQLQEELAISRAEYSSRLGRLEGEVKSVKEENVLARADSLTQQERGNKLLERLQDVDAKADDLEARLAIEKRKVLELETRLKLADMSVPLAKSIEKLTAINELTTDKQRVPPVTPIPHSPIQTKGAIQEKRETQSQGVPTKSQGIATQSQVVPTQNQGVSTRRIKAGGPPSHYTAQKATSPVYRYSPPPIKDKKSTCQRPKREPKATRSDKTQTPTSISKVSAQEPKVETKTAPLLEAIPPNTLQGPAPAIPFQESAKKHVTESQEPKAESETPPLQEAALPNTFQGYAPAIPFQESAKKPKTKSQEPKAETQNGPFQEDIPPSTIQVLAPAIPYQESAKKRKTKSQEPNAETQNAPLQEDIPPSTLQGPAPAIPYQESAKKRKTKSQEPKAESKIGPVQNIIPLATAIPFQESAKKHETKSQEPKAESKIPSLQKIPPSTLQVPAPAVPYQESAKKRKTKSQEPNAETQNAPLQEDIPPSTLQVPAPGIPFQESAKKHETQSQESKADSENAPLQEIIPLCTLQVLASAIPIQESAEKHETKSQESKADSENAPLQEIIPLCTLQVLASAIPIQESAEKHETKSQEPNTESENASLQELILPITLQGPAMAIPFQEFVKKHETESKEPKTASENPPLQEIIQPITLSLPFSSQESSSFIPIQEQKYYDGDRFQVSDPIAQFKETFQKAKREQKESSTVPAVPDKEKPEALRLSPQVDDRFILYQEEKQHFESPPTIPIKDQKLYGLVPPSQTGPSAPLQVRQKFKSSSSIELSKCCCLSKSKKLIDKQTEAAASLQEKKPGYKALPVKGTDQNVPSREMKQVENTPAVQKIDSHARQPLHIADSNILLQEPKIDKETDRVAPFQELKIDKDSERVAPFKESKFDKETERVAPFQESKLIDQALISVPSHSRASKRDSASSKTSYQETGSYDTSKRVHQDGGSYGSSKSIYQDADSYEASKSANRNAGADDTRKEYKDAGRRHSSNKAYQDTGTYGFGKTEYQDAYESSKSAYQDTNAYKSSKSTYQEPDANDFSKTTFHDTVVYNETDPGQKSPTISILGKHKSSRRESVSPYGDQIGQTIDSQITQNERVLKVNERVSFEDRSSDYRYRDNGSKDPPLFYDPSELIDSKELERKEQSETESPSVNSRIIRLIDINPLIDESQQFYQEYPTSCNNYKDMIEAKPRDVEAKLQYQPATTQKQQLEVPSTSPKKDKDELRLSTADDSGYVEQEPQKDDEMLKINRELLKKISDLRAQLDLLIIAAAGANNKPSKQERVNRVNGQIRLPRQSDDETLHNQRFKEDVLQRLLPHSEIVQYKSPVVEESKNLRLDKIKIQESQKFEDTKPTSYTEDQREDLKIGNQYDDNRFNIPGPIPSIYPKVRDRKPKEKQEDGQKTVKILTHSIDQIYIPNEVKKHSVPIEDNDRIISTINNLKDRRSKTISITGEEFDRNKYKEEAEKNEDDYLLNLPVMIHSGELGTNYVDGSTQVDEGKDKIDPPADEGERPPSRLSTLSEFQPRITVPHSIQHAQTQVEQPSCSHPNNYTYTRDVTSSLPKNYTYDVTRTKFSRSTSPDNTEKEISSLPDLPEEKEVRPRRGSMSPGEKGTMTMTETETNTDYGSLSEGEIPATKKLQKSYNEKGVATVTPESTQGMEAVLQAISNELARCHELLKGHTHNGMEDGRMDMNEQVVPLRSTDGAQRLAGTHHVCVFTLHVGTLVLSDEALVRFRDKSLVLMWRFFDQSVTLARMRFGRVVLFDFSTEYNVVFSQDLLLYMKNDKMPLVICAMNKQEEAIASCQVPLRDALLHLNQRADMSLALMSCSEVGADGEEELGVLDLWCLLRADSTVAKYVQLAIATRSSQQAGAGRSASYSRLLEDDLSNERLSQDLEMHLKRESIPKKHRNSGITYSDQEAAHLNHNYLLGIDERKRNRRRSSSIRKVEDSITSNLGHHHPKEQRNLDGWPTNRNSSADTRFIAHSVPSHIKSTEELKVALERKAQYYEDSRKFGKKKEYDNISQGQLSMASSARSNPRKRQLARLKELRKYPTDNYQEPIDSLQDMLTKENEPTKDRKNSYIPKCELVPSSEDKPDVDTTSDISRRYKDISKFLGVNKMIESKKQVKYSDNDVHEEQEAKDTDSQEGQNIVITVLWLALNEECDAMLNPRIKRLYVAYNFLGRSGADLETPVSLPKPKHYVDKCFFNFKKTFNLHECDLVPLGHMARMRAGPRASRDPRDCLVFTVVSEPPEDPLGLTNCEDVGYAYLYLGDILAYSGGSSIYTEVVAVHAARGAAVCGVLAVRIDGLQVMRRALTASSSTRDLSRI